MTSKVAVTNVFIKLCDIRTHPLFTYQYRVAMEKEILYGRIYNPTVRAFLDTNIMYCAVQSENDSHFRTAFRDKKRD